MSHGSAQEPDIFSHAPSDPPARWVGRLAVMPTLHGKVELLAPVLHAALGLQVVGVPGFDTDAFGTFTGEVSRPGDQLETARAKAVAAVAQTGADLALASEGSFGPHPAIPFLPANRELLLLLDCRAGLEIVASVVSTATNYAHRVFDSLEAAWAFAEKVGFPSHGLIVRAGGDPEASPVVAKGLVTPEALEDAVAQALRHARVGVIETDMRAHLNPTRQRAILAAAQDLVQRARSLCQACQTPGFAVVEVVPGLPCEWCGQATRLPLAEVDGCLRCAHTRRREFPAGERFADPGRCDRCNP
jgi:hypothetical protein